MTAIIIDTETTEIKDPEPIEIAYLVYGSELSLSPKNNFQSYYRPKSPISLGAMAVHHIMDEDLIDCPYYTRNVIPEGVQYLIGHNIDFDWRVLGNPEGFKRICTLALCRDIYPETDSHTLSAMLYFLERKTARERLKNAHSALADVGFCESILKHIVVKLNVKTWEELWAASESARIPKVMPFGKHKGESLGKVPPDYLRWLGRQADVDPYLMKAIKGLQ